MPWNFFDKNGNQKQAAASAIVPMAKATLTAAQTINDSTYTIVNWTTEDYDTDSLHDTVTNNSRITINKAGTYRFDAEIIWAAGTAALDYRELDIYKNGATIVGFETRAGLGNAGVTNGMHCSVDIVCAAGDYFETRVYQTRGGTLSVNTGSFFSVAKIDGAVYLPVAYPASLVGQEVAYAEGTSVNVVSTTEASGTTILTAPVFTADGVSRYRIDFFAATVGSPSTLTGYTILSIFEGATQLGRLGSVVTPAASQMTVPFHGSREFIPTAGTHTYSVTAFANVTTGTPYVAGGAGGTGAGLPMFIRITKAS